MFSSEQKVLAVMAHISYLLAGIGFILVPLILMLWKKEDNFVSEHAKQALCMHLCIVIASTVVGVLSFLLVGILLIPLLLLIGLVWFFASIYACWKAVNDEYYSYPLVQWLADRL